MAIILQHPDQYSFVGNIKKIIVSSISEISFKLKKGADIIFESSYSPDLNCEIEIDIKTILRDYVSLELPSVGEITTQPFAVFSFSVDSEEEILFYVFEGGVDAEITSDWFVTNFLTWQPQTTYVTWNQAQYLTYVTLQESIVKIKGYFSDGTDETIIFGNLTTDAINIINLQYSALSTKFINNQPQYVDIWVSDSSGERLSYIQRLVFKNSTPNDNYFLFKNTLGGWDSIIFDGILKNEGTSDVKTYNQDDVSHDYQVDITEKYTKNTGYFKSELYRLWAQEFFKTKDRYFLSKSKSIYEKISVISSTIGSQKGTPSSYSFTFILSKSTKFLNLNRSETLETPLEIIDPTGKLFFLVPRLSEFPAVDLDGNIIFPVQSPFSSEWKKISLESLKEFIAPLILFSKYLRKDIPDTARELITFLKGIKVTGEASVEQLRVLKKAFFKETLSSEDFISGFPGGTGWSLFLKEIENAAGEKENKSILELDQLTIRGALRVYEFIISQLLGENGSRITTDMMRVHSVDIALKTIYLDTESGILYNPFRAGDILMVQQFSSNGIIKQYELQVVSASVGPLQEAEKRLDHITYRNFVGDEDSVAARDVLTRVDSVTDPDRKGVIKQTSVEENSPYLDVLYGMKTTDQASAIKLRLGKLAGIINYWFGQLKGYGLYSDNAYLLGEFRLRTGDDVRTKFEIIEGSLQSAMKSIINTITEDDNFLANAIFQEDMQYWEVEDNVNLYDVGGQLLDLGMNFYSEKNKVASIVSFDGRQMLRIKNSSITQSNAYIRKPQSGSTLYITVKYHCATEGTLQAGFVDSELFINQSITAEDGFKTLSISAEWDGQGDFIFSFSGDIYVERLLLTNRPLDDFKKEVSSKFEQTANQISAIVSRVDNVENTIDSAGWITTADGNLLWASIATVNELGDRVTIHESIFHVTAIEISAIVSRVDTVEDIISSAGWITTADGNLLWASISTVDELGNRITTHEGSFHVTAIEISAIVSRVDTVEDTISSAGWITTADGNQLWASKALENGSTIISYINQTTESVTINATKINLEGLITANGNVQITTDGRIIALNGEFTGKIISEEGTIGGFSIGDGRIGAEASAGGDGGYLAIYNDFFRVGGSDGYVLFGNDVIPLSAGGAFSATGRIVNKKLNTGVGYGFDRANYGLFIDVSGGDKNYGISSNAPLKASAFINTNVGFLNITSSSYSIDFSQSSIFIVYANATYNVFFPGESLVASMFSLSTLPSNFGFVFTLKIKAGSQRITLNDVYDSNESMRGYDMAAGDSAIILVTKTPSFRYQMLCYNI